jgi:GNAT superfamily N-acetyltransferase
MRGIVLFSDLALSRRLERAEGNACMQFAAARRRLYPGCGSEWIECAGAYVVFDGADSPVTQTFGLGLFEELHAGTLDRIELFFFERGASAMHELSPLAGPSAVALLCECGYRPVEISSVLFRAVEHPPPPDSGPVRVRITGRDEADLWGSVSARGWSHDHPEFREMLIKMGELCASREQSLCFLAELDGTPGAAGALCISDGVALFAGAATVPEMRRRGLQRALLEARMRYAADYRCDLAMIVAAAGSESQRNAERQGFRIAYTRTKWRLDPPGAAAPEAPGRSREHLQRDL